MSKWGKVILLLLAMSILTAHLNGASSYLSETVNDSYAKEHSHSSIQPQQEPIENNSIPIISVPNTEFEFGINITISFGMYDEPNFIAGYNYDLYLITGHMMNISNYDLEAETVKFLTSGTTETDLGIFDARTVSQSQAGSTILISPGDYTILFQVNSTNRGKLNETLNIVIKNTLSPIVETEFIPMTTHPIISQQYFTQINLTTTIKVIVRNTGLSDAFQVNIILGSINQPFGLGNITFPIEFPSISSNGSDEFSFTVTPKRWGIGKIQLQIFYLDANGTPFLGSSDFGVNVLPQITGTIQIETVDGKIDIDKNINATVTINYNGPSFTNDLKVIFKLDSVSITFLPIDGREFENNKVDYLFTGTPTQTGSTDLSFLIIFIDKIDGDISTPPRVGDYRRIEIVNQIIRRDQGPNPLLGSILTLYTVIMILIIVFYFRRDVRNKFFSRILGVEFINPLKFPSSSVIIDGSNVAWEEYSINKKAKLSNITLVIKTLKEAGIGDITTIADASLRYQIDNKEELDKMVSQGIIKLTPAKVDADGLILRLAADTGSLILSNDLYKQHREDYSWIDTRRIPYTIINSKIYLHPIFEKKVTSAKK